MKAYSERARHCYPVQEPLLPIHPIEAETRGVVQSQVGPGQIEERCQPEQQPGRGVRGLWSTSRHRHRTGEDASKAVHRGGQTGRD